MEDVIKVLLVDDHAVVRAGLAKVLEIEPRIKILGKAEDGLEAIGKALELKPDVIVMDIFMPRSNGLEAMLAIREKLPGTRVLFLTISEREDHLFEALRLGAQGYLLKSATITELVDGVRRAAAGEAILSPSVASKLIAEFRQKKEDETHLSKREAEVLQLVGEGLTNAEIARRLFISDSTVRTHLQRILEKLHLNNRAEAVARASHSHIDRNSF